MEREKKDFRLLELNTEFKIPDAGIFYFRLIIDDFKLQKFKNGVTLIELLVVIALI